MRSANHSGGWRNPANCASYRCKWFCFVCTANRRVYGLFYRVSFRPAEIILLLVGTRRNSNGSEDLIRVIDIGTQQLSDLPFNLVQRWPSSTQYRAQRAFYCGNTRKSKLRFPNLRYVMRAGITIPFFSIVFFCLMNTAAQSQFEPPTRSPSVISGVFWTQKNRSKNWRVFSFRYRLWRLFSGDPVKASEGGDIEWMSYQKSKGGWYVVLRERGTQQRYWYMHLFLVRGGCRTRVRDCLSSRSYSRHPLVAKACL